MSERTYIAIDLKSFYASVECVERGLDPLGVNLVVADKSRTEKTICLAVSPALKAYGISGRARLFEVVQAVKEINSQRRRAINYQNFTGKSIYDKELKENPYLELDYVVATPQMAKYMRISSAIYNIYLKYIDPNDIHVYSIDEVFIDATTYLPYYNLTAHELTMKLILEVLSTTGITATAGIGTNMYLCKIAMDIEAKHIPPDENGVRIAALNEMTFREKMWTHKPLTDFWRIGKGISARLEANGMYTMGDIARMSIKDEDRLYKLFGINAELIIDHAWGWEPCTISEIKGYQTENTSLSMGQVLKMPYTYEKGRLIVREMIDQLVLDLVEKHVVTDQIVLNIGYDNTSLNDPRIKQLYKGPVVSDWYGKEMPKPAHGSSNLGGYTSSTKIIVGAMMDLYDRIVDNHLLIRRVNVVANHVQFKDKVKEVSKSVQLDFFTDYEAEMQKEAVRKEELEREERAQKTIIDLKRRFGKNAVLKGMNFEEGATTIERNQQVGGHKA